MMFAEVVEIVGYIVALLLGWWLPVVLFYGWGIAALRSAQQRPIRAILWAALFVPSLAYTLYDGVYLRWLSEQRAATFKDLVTYADPPSDIRTLVMPPGSGGCDFICELLLLSGRLDHVIAPYKDRSLLQKGLAYWLTPASRQVPEYYLTYSMVTKPGCKSIDSRIWELSPWEIVGRCIVATKSQVIADRRLEVVINPIDDPAGPRWNVNFTHIQVVDGERVRAIARAERARVDFAFPLPVPGIFPHVTNDVLPTSFWAGFFASAHRSYGPSLTPQAVIGRVFGIDLDRGLPMPNLADQTDDARLAITKEILTRGPLQERHQFIIDQLGPRRPLGAAYRALVLDYIHDLEDKRETRDLIPTIAWLAAGDPDLGPAVVGMYVDRALTIGGSYMRSLSFFGPDLLKPFASRLLAPYAGGNRSDAIMADLDFGIGNAGPAAVEELIKELDAKPLNGERAPTAAVALCRAGDARAVEPLLRQLQEFKAGNRIDHPMSFAYALARLGHGPEAQQALARIRTVTSPERACLDEIIAKYPDGGAPDSSCLLEGPSRQTDEWRFNAAALRCLAPRTPAIYE
jgi:hypothetical protein